jgi:hypothetical protein
MTSTNSTQPAHDAAAGSQALAVVDWSLDPDDVVVALREHASGRTVRFGLLVPARLHGLQWIGDPTASRPCAERQLQSVAGRLRESGLDVGAERIGDPERVPAVSEALGDWAADEILLVDRRSLRPAYWPLGAVRRITRASGLPVRSIPVQSAAKTGARLAWAVGSHRCTRAKLQAV